MNNPIARLWTHAGEMAEATPPSRNRYVDFLRAASILVVILGHWLMAAPYFQDGDFSAQNMLTLAPWAHWLTLVVQVMPIFFLVGGYSNAVAWRAARSRGTEYGPWLGARIQRLMTPVIPVLVVWIGIAFTATALGAPPDLIATLTQAALVPTWFIAVYVMVGVAVPATLAAWDRFGFGSFAMFIAGAVLIDVVAIGMDYRALGYVNYAFVWLAIHQLGHAWQAGRIRRPMIWSAAAAVSLFAMIEVGPYPLAMVGVPGQTLGNSSPPTIALLALGITQMGLVLFAESVARRLLAKRRAWTATVLVNGMIMSLFVWHMTALIAAAAAAVALGGVGLGHVPDSASWWAARPLWIGIYASTLIPLVAMFLRFERPGRITKIASRRVLLAGASLTCVGLGLVSANGIGFGGGFARVLPGFLPLLGTGLVGFGPFARVMTNASGRPS